MDNKRIQLTLFVDEIESGAIERLRKEFNPQQYELIKSHVTLCREHDLKQIDNVLKNLEKLRHSSVTIYFGPVKRFSDEKGVLIPAISDEQFHGLRKKILQGTTDNLSRQEPHITIMHPKNSTCTNQLFEQIETRLLPMKLIFNKISLIEQIDGKGWNIIKEFELKGIG